MATSGHCPACARPFSAAEVAGYGILRSRSAQAGGPIMEFPCPGCGRRMLLIPHGEGRYAPPGQPPPPPVPERERRPPWAREAPPDDEEEGRGRPRPERETRPRGAPEPIDVELPEREEAAPDEPEPLTVTEALELLGVGPEAPAERLEKAFRARSKTCHPDKVAHMDREFQELAERKFKRLREAYDLLRE